MPHVARRVLSCCISRGHEAEGTATRLIDTPLTTRLEDTHWRFPATVHVLVVVVSVVVTVAVVVDDVQGALQNMGHTWVVRPIRQMPVFGRSAHRGWSVMP